MYIKINPTDNNEKSLMESISNILFLQWQAAICYADTKNPCILHVLKKYSAIWEVI